MFSDDFHTLLPEAINRTMRRTLLTWTQRSRKVEHTESLAQRNRPRACIGCRFYHGRLYGVSQGLDYRAETVGARLVCAIYPAGPSSSICKDWEREYRP
ncbi:hypothetical protein [Anthocerotibacter panamensis]|uniref:hypothetical protein n=1 Tax=Anthocerotibacter panamensis TaxID=2857077 RepID=UPI001C4023D4|nr:hypothetical protein [Anthocerotibacter panamensis]